MAIVDLLHTMSSMTVKCTKNISRATKRLWWIALPFFRGRKAAGAATAADGDNFRHQGDLDIDGVWKHDILLGEKCKHLKFSGVIHYDSYGRPLPEPRAPLRGSPPSHCTVDIAQLERSNH